MMRKLSTGLIFGLAMSLSSVVLAARPNRSPEKPEEITTVNAEVPQARIQRVDPADQLPAHSQLAIGISSWMPAFLSFPSYHTAPTALSRDSVPMIYVQDHFFLGAFRDFEFSGHAGAGFLGMKRTQAGYEQSIAIIRGSFGLDLIPAPLRWARGHAHLGLAFIPTIAMASRSPVSEGASASVFPAEFSAGLFMGSRYGLDISVAQVLGNSVVVGAKGTAFRGAFRFEI